MRSLTGRLDRDFAAVDRRPMRQLRHGRADSNGDESRFDRPFMVPLSVCGRQLCVKIIILENTTDVIGDTDRTEARCGLWMVGRTVLSREAGLWRHRRAWREGKVFRRTRAVRRMLRALEQSKSSPYSCIHRVGGRSVVGSGRAYSLRRAAASFARPVA